MSTFYQKYEVIKPYLINNTPPAPNRKRLQSNEDERLDILYLTRRMESGDVKLSLTTYIEACPKDINPTWHFKIKKKISSREI